MRTRLVVLAGLLLGLVGVHPVTATAAAGDAATVTGYDLLSEVATPVTAGDADNRLVVTVTVGAAVVDGAVTIDLPSGAWRTPLTAIPADQSLEATDVGTVAARPAGPQVPADSDCQGVGRAPLTWSVGRVGAVQRIVVPHVECAAGGTLTVRINGVRAPRAGRYALPVRLTDAGAVRLAGRAPLTVVPAPTTRLELRLPGRDFVVDRPFAAAVVAVRPDGRLDRGYRGAVALAPADEDFCGFPTGRGVAATFTADDGGVKPLSLSFGLATVGDGHTLSVRAVDRSARPSAAAPFAVTGVPEVQITCNPVSFH